MDSTSRLICRHQLLQPVRQRQYEGFLGAVARVLVFITWCWTSGTVTQLGSVTHSENYRITVLCDATNTQNKSQFFTKTNAEKVRLQEAQSPQPCFSTGPLDRASWKTEAYLQKVLDVTNRKRCDFLTTALPLLDSSH